MWVLKEQGARFEHRADSSDSAAGLTVDAGEPCLDEQSFANEGNCVTLNFPSSHDGRGFSFAKRVRRERGEGVRIIATGNLIPDQARMAFQCGFSEIHLSDELVSRHGETAWRAATMVAPDALYTKSGKAPSIWDARHQHSVKIKSLTSAEAFEDLQRSARGFCWTCAPPPNGSSWAALPLNAALVSSGRPSLTAQKIPISLQRLLTQV